MRAVQDLAGDDTDDLNRVAPLLSEIGNPRRPNALDFFRRKARTQRDIREQRQRGRKIPAQAARRYGRGIARRAGIERRANLRHFVGELRRRAGRRALIEHVGRKAGEPGLVERIRIAAAPHDEVRRHDGHAAGLRQRNHRQAVRQLERLRHGHAHSFRRSGARLLLAPWLVGIDRHRRRRARGRLLRRLRHLGAEILFAGDTVHDDARVRREIALRELPHRIRRDAPAAHDVFGQVIGRSRRNGCTDSS